VIFGDSEESFQSTTCNAVLTTSKLMKTPEKMRQKHKNALTQNGPDEHAQKAHSRHAELLKQAVREAATI